MIPAAVSVFLLFFLHQVSDLNLVLFSGLNGAGEIFGHGKIRKRKRFSRDEGSDESDEDFVLEDEEEESDDGSDDSCTSRDFSEENFEFASNSSSDGERNLVRSKPRKGFSNRKRPKVKRSVGRVRVSNEEDDDEEFLPDSDDYSFEDQEESLLVKKTWIRKRVRRKKGSVKCRKTTKKSKVSKKSSRKRRGRLVPRKRADSDDDFIVEDRIVHEKKNKLKPRTSKKRSCVVSDSDFVDSGSDSDYTIFDEERDTVRAPAANCRNLGTCLRSSSQSKRCRAEEDRYRQLRKRENFRPVKNDDPVARKGKEKVESSVVDVGKQMCGICLSEEQRASVRGSLNCCNHYFCFACIMEWAKVESRCPLCKQRFVSIGKSARPEMGLRNTVIRVPQRDQVYRPSEEELRGYLDPYANIVCMECQQGGDDSLMLLCDVCDSAAHTYCVGLGREVPEGNWYCEGCWSADPRSSNSQAQDSVPDQVTGNSGLCTEDSAGGIDAEVVDASHRTSQISIALPEQSLSLENNTYSSPRCRALEDPGAPSPVSGAGATTVLGRRRLRRQIHILLSNRTESLPHDSLENDVVEQGEGPAGCAKTTETSAHGTRHDGDEPEMYSRENPFWLVRNRDPFLARSSHLRQQVTQSPGTSAANLPADESIDAEGRTNLLQAVLGFQQQHQGNRPIFGPDVYIAPCGYSEGNSFRRVEGAKELVRTMVKTHLKRSFKDTGIVSRNSSRDKFKEIARNATHTILAACGIEHSLGAATPVQPPPNCSHVKNDGEKVNLMKGCCYSCFDSFVGDVAMMVMNKKLEGHE